MIATVDPQYRPIDQHFTKTAIDDRYPSNESVKLFRAIRCFAFVVQPVQCLDYGGWLRLHVNFQALVERNATAVDQLIPANTEAI